MRIAGVTTKSIKRHFSRISIVVIVLSIAVATVVSLMTISAAMKRDFADKVDTYGTNMVIVPKSKNLSMSYGGVTVGSFQYESKTLRESDVDRLKTIKNKQNLATIAPKLLGVTDVKGSQAMIVGVRFPEELKIKKWWKFGAGKAPKAVDEAIVGANAADKLGLSVGETITLGKSRFKVSGVLKRLGTQEDDLIYVDLKQAQTLFGKPGQLSMIEVAAWCTTCPIEAIVSQASRKLPYAKVSAVLQAAKARDALISQVIVFSVILSAIIVLGSVLIVFTNMLASVRERRHEIGIFRAIGYRRLHILKIVLLESAFVGLVSGITGYVIGYALARFLAPAVAGVDVDIPAVNLYAAYLAIIGTVGVALLASLYPAAAAAKLSPTVAMETIQ